VSRLGASNCVLGLGFVICAWLALTAGCTSVNPSRARSADTSHARSVNPRPPGPCPDCVRWEIPRITSQGIKLRLSDGTTVISNHHGIRYLDIAGTKAGLPFETRPEAVAQLGNGQFAWIDASGSTTITETPVGPPIRGYPFPERERPIAVFACKQALLVFGQNGRVFRSVDGGASWPLVDLGLSPPARFESLGTDESGTELMVKYHPTQFVRSQDAGATWQRVQEPSNYVAKRFDPAQPFWPHEFEPDPENVEAADREGPLFVAGDQILRIHRRPSGFEIAARAFGSDERSELIEDVEVAQSELAAVAGDGGRAMVMFTKVGQAIPYVRASRGAPFERFTPLVEDTVPRRVVLGELFLGAGHAFMVDKDWGAPRLVVWPGRMAPQIYPLDPEDRIAAVLVDPPHQNVFVFGFRGEVHLGHFDPTQARLRLRRTDLSFDAVRSEYLPHEKRVLFGRPSFDTQGTLRCYAYNFGGSAYLVRIDQAGRALPLLVLPFVPENPVFAGRKQQIGFVGMRGYSSSGWETADGGEHWTRVGAYAAAQEVECSAGGCLVDRAMRIGWALPEGWSGGEPAVPPGGLGRK
jgi:hypothetical protein